ncbi:hypothetical protein P171DRAFT_503888 [Karstenula rhodostoma CBS 690.94]|uniref:CCHC-type domain-containing protein n=1 Tax=Karstenula rhodostoma CBS 690.94 TaxID=1392251 RepID=A0A9P4UIC2_9PLEO|nr:hypothetical protein P171DRAFT_503888 [Karstenula rhodostoma CBS 690.94]
MPNAPQLDGAIVVSCIDAEHFERDQLPGGASELTYGRLPIVFHDPGIPTCQSMDDVEASSRIYSNANFGIARYCTRCHRTNHFKKDCRAGIQPCQKCQARRVPGKDVFMLAFRGQSLQRDGVARAHYSNHIGSRWLFT